MDSREIAVRPVRSAEEARYQELMERHHYLGALPKISEMLWYVATWREEWVALLSFSDSALKCAARDGWIGWDLRHRFSRLKPIVNNSRFLIAEEEDRSRIRTGYGPENITRPRRFAIGAIKFRGVPGVSQ